MSGWDAYVKSLLDSEESIKKAAIISASDGSIWAKSDGSSLGENFAVRNLGQMEFLNLLHRRA